MLAVIMVGLGVFVSTNEPTDRPKATLELVPQPDVYQFSIEITTVSGARYVIPIDVETNVAQAARDSIYREMVCANWLVDTTDQLGLVVYGVRGKRNATDPIKSLVIRTTKEQKGDIAKPGRVGDVRVEVRKDDGKPARNPPPRGPDVGKENYVEFDFNPVPCDKESWHLTFRVETTRENLSVGDPVSYSSNAPARILLELHCASLARAIGEAGFKAEVVDQVKVRVYGGLYDGKFYPATKGTVESPDLKKDELPKVTNPPQG